MATSYSSEGIILTSRDYGEADRILVIYTKYKGPVSVIAKGVRRPKSRKRGSLEIFNHIKFQSVKTRGLDIILEAEVINSFANISNNLNKISVAYYFAEVIGRTTRDNEKNTNLYLHLLNNLLILQNTTQLKKLRREFAIKTLELLGFWPKNREITNPDNLIEELLERKLGSVRVGKKLQK